MKKTIPAFALPLLLALSPTAASAARILWVNVEEAAMVEDAKGNQTSVSSFATASRTLAAKVSVGDATGSPITLLYVYEDGGRMVVDENSTTMPLVDDVDTSDFTGMSWAPVYVSDDVLARIDDSATVSLTLGYVDGWEPSQADPSMYVEVNFDEIAVATSSWSDLVAGNHLSEANSLAPAGQTPWSPQTFTAVPEPATCGLALLGVLLLAKRRKPRSPAGRIDSMPARKPFVAAAVLVGLAASVQAGYYPGSTDLEGDDPLADGLWTNAGGAEVVADASVASVSRPANLPPSFDATSRTNVLVVDTGDTVVRHLQAGQAAPAASTIYADVLVRGCPVSAEAPAPEASADDKILVYTRINQSGDATNLCVYAKDGADGTAKEFVLTKTVGEDEWHRIVIKATTAGYQIYCDGVEAANLCQTAGGVNTFYALTDGAPMTSVGFTGTGAVDDLVLSSFDPADPVYTLKWDASLASVSYTVGGADGEPLAVADGEYAFQAPTNTEIVITGNNGYRDFSSAYTISSSTSTLELVEPTGIAKYTTGAGTEQNPYEIPCYEALVEMKDLVASNATARSAFYVQTADIDCTGKAAFEGIGTYAKVPTSGTPFTGTYDGRGHTIANVTRAGGDTQGIFNQVGVGGTVENLVVSNMVFASDVSGECGFAIVGNAGGGATLRNLTAAGVFGAADKPGTHNMAGIVVRLSPGATAGAATTIDSCTNNATIYGAYTKLGGINAIVQNQTGFVDGKVVFANCANNGTLVCKRTATDVTGNAGIVGYIAGTNVELTGCYGNGDITNADGANTDKDGALVGWTNGGTIADNGGNAAPADKKMIGTWGDATETGFLYATVDNGVATTIEPPYALAAGNAYLFEGQVAASAAPVATLTDVGQTIAFDEALGYTNVAGMVAATAPFVVTASTNGTVTTYAATLAAATWIGGAQGDWETNTNWSVGYVPTKDTVVTFTNDAQVAILGSDRCKELVLSNATVTLVRDANATEPVLHFHGNEGRAVSVASGATGSLAVNNLTLFTERADGDLTIGCDLQVLGSVSFRGLSIVANQRSSSFAITGKTTVSADAKVKTIDWGTTKFQGGIEVAKGVTAKITTMPNGGAQIGTGVTLVANDGEGAPTAVWLMRSAGNSLGVSLVGGASVAVDADHAAAYYPKVSSATEWEKTGNVSVGVSCDVYTALPKPTVAVTTGENVTAVTGVTDGQYVIPGTNLVIGVSGVAEGYEPLVTIRKNADSSVLLTTNAVPFTYTMPDFDIDVSATAVKTAQGYNDPEGNEIGDPVVIGWLADKHFTQDDIDALGKDAAATDKLYECYLLNCSITAQDPGGTIHTTGIAVTNGVVSIAVQLVRQKPLGFINGVLHVYGADDLAAGFSRSPISDEIVFFSEGDSIFDTDPAEGAVTQSVTATFSLTDVTATFFQAKIEFPLPPDEPEDPGDPEETEEP